MDRSPRVRRVTFLPLPPHIPHRVPDDIGLRTPTLPRPRSKASHAIRVPRVGSLPPASFRSHLTMGTLAVRLGVPVIKASKGLSPSSHFPVGFRLPVDSAVMALRAMPGARRGRNAGYPAPPAQIPACGITAPGSCLGSDAEASLRAASRTLPRSLDAPFGRCVPHAVAWSGFPLATGFLSTDSAGGWSCFSQD